MKICIIGGTGGLGEGLALRWSLHHDVVIGSRSLEKALHTAENYSRKAKHFYTEQIRGSIKGQENISAVKDSDVIILSIPYETIQDMTKILRGNLSEDQVIVSPIVPLKKTPEGYKYLPFVRFDSSTHSIKILSAAEVISEELPPSSRVISALHTLPMSKLKNLNVKLDCDTLICGDDKRVVTILEGLLKEIPGLRPLHVGPLSASMQVESITPMILNLSIYSKIKSPSIKIV